MSDLGQRVTETELTALEKRIAEVYRTAAKDVQKALEEYNAKLAKRDAEMKARLEAGEITPEYYKQWRLNQEGRGARFEALRDKLAERMTNANEEAMEYINQATPKVYLGNRNYTAYQIESAYPGVVDFTLWDESTVQRLIKTEPDIMPNYPKSRAIRRGIDLDYGKKKITQVTTSGILRGLSIGQIADELEKYLTQMDRTASLRAARTAMVCAQNAGRQDTLVEATKLGIHVMKKWRSVADERTRDSHINMNNQIAEQNERFTNGLMYPGDRDGAPEEVYNCRCTMTYLVPGMKDYKTADIAESQKAWNQWQEQKQEMQASRAEAKARENGLKVKQTGGKFIVGTDAWFNEQNKKDAAAEKYYDVIRKSNDISAVAKSSGYTEEQIRRVKNHVFFDEHILYLGEIERFIPDYDMAVAWKRLAEGNPYERDIDLIRHELIESEIEKKYNLPADEAHGRAKEICDWNTRVLEETDGDGEEYGIL